jgi:hypothetical protein
MAVQWKGPYYQLTSASGKKVTIDVTTSVSAGLKANQLIEDDLPKFLRARGIERVVDFGAGALRHTLPLIKRGFSVCAVEFEEVFKRPKCAGYRVLAEKNPNFSALIWPNSFLGDRRKFSCALLVYVLQTMPLPAERALVLKALSKKLTKDAYILYLSRFGEVTDEDKRHKVSDGYYRWPDRDEHSFYTEFTTEDTHKMFKKQGFTRLKSYPVGGQAFLYGRGGATWP